MGQGVRWGALWLIAMHHAGTFSNYSWATWRGIEKGWRYESTPSLAHTYGGSILNKYLPVGIVQLYTST